MVIHFGILLVIFFNVLFSDNYMNKSFLLMFLQIEMILLKNAIFFSLIYLSVDRSRYWISTFHDNKIIYIDLLRFCSFIFNQSIIKQISCTIKDMARVSYLRLNLIYSHIKKPTIKEKGLYLSYDQCLHSPSRILV